MKGWNSYIEGPIPTHCPQCHKENDGTICIFPQNTAYVRADRNYVTCCEACQKENDEHWTEMWNEYYRSIR